MKKLILFLLMLLPLAVNAQWAVSPNGVLVDSITKEPYVVILRDGTADELYKDVLKNVHRKFVRPDDVVSTLENEMISLRGYGHTTLKYAGITQHIRPLISVKIEFKDNRMRVTGNWVSALIGNALSGKPNEADPYTLFVKGGWKCFDKKGGIKNQKRYEIYNSAVNQFINDILTVTEEEEW